jgi:Fe-S-cluster containining protein
MAIGSINEMIAEMKSGVFDYTDNGACTNCGQCCGNYLPISTKEIQIIKRYIKKHNIAEQIRKYPTANALFDMQCPFRDEINKKCTIYEVRPAICRDFKCDKPRKNIEADKALYHSKYEIVDMRMEFYNGTSVMGKILVEMVNGK